MVILYIFFSPPSVFFTSVVDKFNLVARCGITRGLTYGVLVVPFIYLGAEGVNDVNFNNNLEIMTWFLLLLKDSDRAISPCCSAFNTLSFYVTSKVISVGEKRGSCGRVNPVFFIFACVNIYPVSLANNSMCRFVS